MDTEPDYSKLMLNQSESSPPSDHQPKLKRLKKKNTITNPIDTSNTPSPPSAMEPETRDNDESDDDGLDPLFPEADQTGVKRVLAFNDFVQGFDEIGDGSDFDDNKEHKEEEKKKKRRKKRSDDTSVGPDGKAKVSKRKQMQERKAHLAQLADFQRVMRERKGVGFKPVPMVEKPISSVLAKIRQRKMEVSKKAMFSRSIQRTDPQLEAVLDDDPEENNYVFEVSDARPKKYGSVKPVAGLSVLGTSLSASPVKETSDDIAHSNDEQTTPSTISKLYPLVAETTQPFRAPANDTQDLFSESQTSNTEDDRSTEDSDSPTPAEDVAPSLPSLNLKFDSALPDDISSDEEESDKENIEPYPKQNHFTKNSSPKGDPVRKFVDEEALEDDSDNELLSVDDDEEEGDDDASMEELKDYIASDNKEKEADIERRNELHQMWLQQQDEAGTENLLQQLKYGTTNMKQREVSLLEDEDDCCMDVDQEEDESDDEDAIDREQIPSSGARLSTKKLKQMIPHMFTDKDDGFVSSEDEETERKLSKQRLLQRVELEEPSKFLSPAEDATSREVFSRIKKLNVVPETKKKPNTSTYFDSLLKKGGSNNSLKSSFLRRASSQPVPSSSTHRHGPSTGRSFIFGRDDSSSRTSISLPDNTSDLSQKENQPKRSASAKFIGSQTKWSTQRTEIRGETVSHTSLFELLKRSSIQTGHDARDDIVDHQAVFAAFKSVKKSVKVEGRS